MTYAMSVGFPLSLPLDTDRLLTVLKLRRLKGSKAGTHAQGIAADIRIHSGAEGFVIVSKAIKMGFRGIGVAKTFIHLDVRKTMPVIWSY
jgi:hypothetical protein